MYYVKHLILITAAILFVGCSKPCVQLAPKVITEIETKYYYPPEELFAKITIPLPTSKTEYLKSSITKREQQLTILILKLYKELGIAQNSLGGLTSWITKMKLYNTEKK